MVYRFGMKSGVWYLTMLSQENNYAGLFWIVSRQKLSGIRDNLGFRISEIMQKPYVFWSFSGVTATIN